MVKQKNGRSRGSVVTPLLRPFHEAPYFSTDLTITAGMF